MNQTRKWMRRAMAMCKSRKGARGKSEQPAGNSLLNKPPFPCSASFPSVLVKPKSVDSVSKAIRESLPKHCLATLFLSLISPEALSRTCSCVGNMLLCLRLLPSPEALAPHSQEPTTCLAQFSLPSILQHLTWFLGLLFSPFVSPSIRFFQ